MKHNHALDGRIHEGCGACAYIQTKTNLAKREKSADVLAKHYSDKLKGKKKT